jgi:hypothetical protein
MADILTDEEFGKINYDELVQAIDSRLDGNQQQYEQNEQPQEQQLDNGYEQQQQQQYQEPYQDQEQNYNNPDVNTTSNQGDIDPAIYKEVYDKITSPFKANGREFQVRNVDEAISLMQKGVDYTRKQQALKPRLNEMRTLEEQGMLGDNLNYAIDLYNGNPKAIAKLIKDKGIDINTLVPQPTTDEFGNPVEPKQQDTPYIPNNYGLSEERLKFKEVVDTLNETGMYSKVDTALDDFDKESRNKFARNPNYYLVLSDLIQKGHYEPIKQELEHQKIVGNPRIQGMNDMDAFSVIANDYFAKLNPQQQQQPVPQEQFNQQQVQVPNQSYGYASQQQYQYQQQQAIQQRKQGAGAIKSTPGKAVTQYDPLRCSDAEFAKIDINELMRR